MLNAFLCSEIQLWFYSGILYCSNVVVMSILAAGGVDTWFDSVAVFESDCDENYMSISDGMSLGT